MAVYKAKACPVCGTIHNRLFLLCAMHERRLERHGSATGRAIPAAELKPYRPIAKGLLHKYEKDQAIAAGHRLMESILTGYGADDHEHAGVGRRCRPYLDRLVDGGGTARSSLLELLALTLYWECGDVRPSAAEMDMALARRLLQHRQVKGNRVGNMRRKVIGGLGYRIRCDLLVLLLQIAKHYLRSVKAHDDQRLAARDFAPTF